MTQRASWVKTQTMKGFTIVELLVVIVVIAILAAITVVSFMGIQQRAVTVAYVSATDGMEKQIRIALTEGKLLDLDTGGLFVCTGRTADFPAGDGLANGQCSTTGNYLTQATSPVYANDTISTTLENAGVHLPGKLSPTNRSGMNGTGITARGIVLYADNQRVGIWWYPPDASTCGRAANETEGMITLFNSSPTLKANAESTYGPDWQTVIRNALGGWCALKIEKQ